MSEIIKWKIDGKYHADPTKCKDEIESIGSDVKPQQIVDYAKNPATELHKCFTWDNNLAAEKWRLQEARQIVCSLVIVESNSDRENDTQIPQDRQRRWVQAVTVYFAEQRRIQETS